MDKQTVVHPYNGLLFRNLKNKLSTHEKIWCNLKCILLSEKYLIQKGYVLFPTIWHSGQCKTMDSKKKLVFARNIAKSGRAWGEEGMNKLFSMIQ